MGLSYFAESSQHWQLRNMENWQNWQLRKMTAGQLTNSVSVELQPSQWLFVASTVVGPLALGCLDDAPRVQAVAPSPFELWPLRRLIRSR